MVLLLAAVGSYALSGKGPSTAPSMIGQVLQKIKFHLEFNKSAVGSVRRDL